MEMTEKGPKVIMEKHIQEMLVNQIKKVLVEAYSLGRADMWSEIYALKEAIHKKELEKSLSD